MNDTSKPNHAPEPWTLEASTLFGADERPIATLIAPQRGDTLFQYVRKDDAARIVACVNACQGINPEAVPMMLEVLQEALCLMLVMDGGFTDNPTKAKIRAAIAKATGAAAPLGGDK